jgi:hypothetical protein
MKTQRITFLASSEFKAFLSREAERTGVSVAELVRQRCEGGATEDEQILSHLAAQLRASVKQAQKSLREGLAVADDTIIELKRESALRKKMKVAA